MRQRIWVFFFLPEVKDRTLEEIDEMVSAFDFYLSSPTRA